ncbi:MAG: DUF2232 domain-containing protein [Spirochaetota bacterium]|nr:DUF2232 domain-containing protein [Spirochaetota bacterium]
MVSIFIFILIGFFLLIGSAILSFKWSRNELILLYIAIGFILLIVIIDNDYLPFVLYPITIGVSAGITFRHKRSLQSYILLSSLLLTIILSSNYYILKIYKNIDLFANSKDKFIELIGQTPNISQSEVEVMQNRFDDLLEIVRDIIPFTYFLNSIFIAGFCFYLIKFFFIRYQSDIDIGVKDVEYYRLHDYSVFIFILGWLVVLLLKREENNILFVISLNVSLAMSVLYLIQGIGIIKFFLIKKGIPIFLLSVLFIIIFLLGIEYILFFSVILSSMGVFDLWLDFRKLMVKDEGQ